MLEFNIFNIYVGLTWLTVVLWLGSMYLTLRGVVRQKPLAPSNFEEDIKNKDAPFVSILVPARDEERRILRQSIQSMLGQDYESFEVVAVNDRSTDRTGEILHTLARENPRLRVVDGREPPAGWLGKPHALQQAFDAVGGSWILATDADMIFAPGALGTAVRHALAEDYDALTLIPYIECLSFWERVFMPTFGWFMLMAMPTERVNDPSRAEAVGIGGFFLIRRSSLERVGGYGAVRADVAEDLRTAGLLKSSGARLRIDYAPELLRTRMQTNLKEIWEGFTKNLFAGAKFSFPFAVFSSVSVFLYAVAPALLWIFCLLMIISGDASEWLRLFVPAFFVWLVQVWTFAIINRNWGIPVVYAFFVPLGHALFILILLNSAFKVATGQGVTWKGRTLYERDGVRPPRPQNETSPSSPIADEQRS